MSFDKRLRLLREQRKLNQIELSKDLSISNVTLSQYENGARKPDINTLRVIAEYFKVSTDYLLGLTDNPTMYPEPDVLAAHRTDDWDTELPEEARKSLESFKEYLLKKHFEENKN